MKERMNFQRNCLRNKRNSCKINKLLYMVMYYFLCKYVFRSHIRNVNLVLTIGPINSHIWYVLRRSCTRQFTVFIINVLWIFALHNLKWMKFMFQKFLVKRDEQELTSKQLIINIISHITITALIFGVSVGIFFAATSFKVGVLRCEG